MNFASLDRCINFGSHWTAFRDGSAATFDQGQGAVTSQMVDRMLEQGYRSFRWAWRPRNLFDWVQGKIRPAERDWLVAKTQWLFDKGFEAGIWDLFHSEGNSGTIHEDWCVMGNLAPYTHDNYVKFQRVISDTIAPFSLKLRSELSNEVTPDWEHVDHQKCIDQIRTFQVDVLGRAIYVYRSNPRNAQRGLLIQVEQDSAISRLAATPRPVSMDGCALVVHSYGDYGGEASYLGLASQIAAGRAAQGLEVVMTETGFARSDAAKQARNLEFMAQACKAAGVPMATWTWEENVPGSPMGVWDRAATWNAATV